MESQFTGKDVADERYDVLKSTAEKHVWRDCNMPLPEIGKRINVCMNGLGPGTVVAYFISMGYVIKKGGMPEKGYKVGDEIWYTGVEVKLDEQPDWHLKQCGEGCHTLVFGTEVREIG